MTVAIRIICRIGLGRGPVSKLIGGMRENSVPPVKHSVGVTLFVCRVVSRTSTRGNCYTQLSAYPVLSATDYIAPLPEPPKILIVIGAPLIAF